MPVLSYDAATLEEDQAAGAAYLTAGYREDYDQLYEVIRANAPEVGTVVTTEVVSSGIVRSGTDRVQVLVFVNRPTTNKQQKQPVVYRDQVTVTMVRVGGLLARRRPGHLRRRRSDPGQVLDSAAGCVHDL